ncbi:MAG: 2,3-bisphosphoglycerate-independent phosphoglycerate mutase [Candidatus Moraniibacteriota bacterium]
MSSIPKPVVLIVLDGWGISNTTQGNPIREAKLPFFEQLNRNYPLTTLQASGVSVGLPWNTEGNSEVGHMTLGAGQVIYQNLPRITLSMQSEEFFANPAFLEATNKVKATGGALHLMGLLSEGSVHSHRDHLYALLKLAKDQGIEKLFVHVFTDGRDSSPTAGATMIQDLNNRMRNEGIGKLASLGGRNFGMDRNNNWDRVQKAYQILTEGGPNQTADPQEYIKESYHKEVTDEYIEPVAVTENGKPIGIIQDGDAIIFFNFREDRAREITKAFTLPKFDSFPRSKKLDLVFVTMTEYEQNLPVLVAFPPAQIKDTLGEILSHAGKTQLRIAETEKYAHVTYFFNGGNEKAWEGEERILIPSPFTTHFDEVPEMSTPKITDKVLELLPENKYDFILINYANPDMVAHTGNEKATIEAVESVDKTLSILLPKILEAGGAIFITADHGNAEELKKIASGEIDTEHSNNPVPLWFISPDNQRQKTAQQMMEEQNTVQGLLSDVAPTILDLMGIPKPEAMRGDSLLSFLN